jgi:hypothetical protein
MRIWSLWCHWVGFFGFLKRTILLTLSMISALCARTKLRDIIMNLTQLERIKMELERRIYEINKEQGSRCNYL